MITAANLIASAWAAGLSVIPITPGAKFPRGRWKAYQATRATQEEAQAWAELPAYGIVTGTLSGVIVVDADDIEARTWCLQNLPPTPLQVETGLRPDGTRGLHLYYRHPGHPVPNRARVHGLRLDVRGDGGQVLGPGSRHPGSGAYYQATQPLTRALIEALPYYPADLIGGHP